MVFMQLGDEVGEDSFKDVMLKHWSRFAVESEVLEWLATEDEVH